jgi:hypothetical protein
MVQLEGLMKIINIGDLFCKFKKIICSLKQVQKVWNEQINSSLLSFSFQKSQAYHNIFTTLNYQDFSYILLFYTWMTFSFQQGHDAIEKMKKFLW